MHGVLDQILAEKEKIRQMNCFHFCAATNSWSRILKQSQSPFELVELALTPSNADEPHEGETLFQTHILPIKIRKHRTFIHPSDELKHRLPDNVLSLMIRRLGREFTLRLLTEDFYSSISINKLPITNHFVCLDDFKKAI